MRIERTIKADKAGFLAEVEKLRDEYIAMSKDDKRLKRERISYAGMAFGVERVMHMIRDWEEA